MADTQSGLIGATNARFVRWNPSPVTVEVSAGPAFVKASIPRSVAVVANRTHVSAKVRGVMRSAAKKYLARAYIHWYQEQGLELADFEAAFEAASDVVLSYDEVAKSRPRA